MITRSVVRDWLLAYLNHEIDAARLAKWAQMILNEGPIYPADESIVRHVLMQLRWLDTRTDGLTWEELSDLLQLLGYQTRVTAEPTGEEELYPLADDAVESDPADSAPPW